MQTHLDGGNRMQHLDPMRERVILGLRQEADLRTLRAALIEAGARSVETMAGLAGTAIAEVDGDRVDSFLAAASAMPGIRYAERDQLRSTF